MIIRQLIVAVAKKLPPKMATDRVLPWFTATIGLSVALSGVLQYANRVQAERVQRVIDLHQRYIADPGSMKQKLRDISDDIAKSATTAMCRFVKEQAANGQLSSIVLQPGFPLTEYAHLDCDTPEGVSKAETFVRSVKLTEPAQKDLREQIGKASEAADSAKLDVPERILDFLNEMVTCVDAGACDVPSALKRVRDHVREALKDRAKLKGPEQILDFLNAIVTCVDAGACDEPSAFVMFGSDMTDLLNNFCDRFEDDAKRWNTESADAQLAHFLLRNGIREKVLTTRQSRESRSRMVFRCEHLREIEANYRR